MASGDKPLRCNVSLLTLFVPKTKAATPYGLSAKHGNEASISTLSITCDLRQPDKSFGHTNSDSISKGSTDSGKGR